MTTSSTTDTSSRVVRDVRMVHEYARGVAAGAILAGPYVRQACDRHLRDLESGQERGLWFDENAAQFALTFFSWLHLEEDVWFVLEDFQVFIVGSLFGWKRTDGHRRFRRAYIEIGKGNGKALALDTRLPTPTGWTTMGEVRVGDWLIDERGEPTQVLAATEVMAEHPCYRVTFRDGTVIVADAEHLWPMDKFIGNHRERVQVTTRDMHQLGARYPRRLTAGKTKATNEDGVARWRTLPTPALDMPQETTWPLPPYLLGYWLGDGDRDCPRITVHRDDIPALRAKCEQLGVEFGEPKPTHGETFRVRFGRGWAQRALRAAGLLFNKHIPPTVMRGAASDRLELLRGLMDSDGSVDRDGGKIELSFTNERLALGAVELMRTLGLYPRMNPGPAVLNGVRTGTRYRITVAAFADAPIFSLLRKAERLRARGSQAPYSQSRTVTAIEEVDSEPVRCVSVGGPSQLYLAGEGMVPTHNSPLASAVGLKGLCADGQSRPEIYAAATTARQSRILYNDARAIVKATPKLREQVRSLMNNMTYKDGKFEPVSSEGGTESGFRPHMGLVDEIHEHPTDEIIEKIRAGTKRNLDAMILEITNSGSSRATPCWEDHQYSLNVLDGIFDDDSWFAYVCSLDEDDDWQDEAVWPKANPGLDTILPSVYLREQVREAVNKPAKQNLVKRLNFCIWTEQIERWLDMALWRKNAGKVSIEELRGQACYGGLDLASRRDFTAFSLFFPKTKMLLSFFWVPEAMETRTGRERELIAEWARQGVIKLTSGNITDYDQVREDIEELGQTFAITEIGYDQWNATQLATQLGTAGATMVPMQQGGAHMSEAAKDLEAMVAGVEMQHGENPVLDWMASNVAVQVDRHGNVRLDREHSGDRIDGIAAAVMAIARALVHQDKPDAGVQIWV